MPMRRCRRVEGKRRLCPEETPRARCEPSGERLQASWYSPTGTSGDSRSSESGSTRPRTTPLFSDFVSTKSGFAAAIDAALPRVGREAASAVDHTFRPAEHALLLAP